MCSCSANPEIAWWKSESGWKRERKKCSEIWTSKVQGMSITKLSHRDTISYFFSFSADLFPGWDRCAPAAAPIKKIGWRKSKSGWTWEEEQQILKTLEQYWNAFNLCNLLVRQPICSMNKVVRISVKIRRHLENLPGRKYEHCSYFCPGRFSKCLLSLTLILTTWWPSFTNLNSRF